MIEKIRCGRIDIYAREKWWLQMELVSLMEGLVCRLWDFGMEALIERLWSRGRTIEFG